MKKGLLENIGLTASFLCGIHCLVTPFLFLLLPFSAGHNGGRGEFLIIAGIAVLAFWLNIRDYRLHHRILPIILVLCGIIVISCEQLFSVHNIVSALGGTMMFTAFLINRHYRRHYHVCAH